jgi:hypothetical protein
MNAAAPPVTAPRAPVSRASGTLWRCGGVTCPPGACNHDDEVMREGADGQAPAVAPPIVHQVLSTPGRRLDRDLRLDMERRFGHDFGSVRVHDDAAAAESASAVRARAYTVGDDIVFGRGATHGDAGRRTIAHELAHAAQYSGGRSAVGPLTISKPHDPAELEASRLAAAAVDGTCLTPVATPAGAALRPDRRVLHRQAQDAGPGPDPRRALQVACVIRLGGCTQSRDAGIPSREEILGYNARCRDQYQYPIDVFPTDEECRNPPDEPLSPLERVLIGALLVAGATVAAAVLVVGAVALAEAAIPVVIAAVEAGGAAAMSATAFYYANAIVINEIGLFAAGVLISCEGDVAGLLRALATDPAQALVMLAEIYILHVNIQSSTGQSRPARLPVKLAPQAEQTQPGRIKFKTAGPPTFEGHEIPPEPEHPIGPPAPPKTSSPAAATEAPHPIGPPAPAGTKPAALSYDVDAEIEQAIVEHPVSTASPAPRSPLRPPPATGLAAAARKVFNTLRDGYAKKLSVDSGGQVHHAIELQTLDRYPRAYQASELNDYPNMRGIPNELQGKRQLHNSKIREMWDNEYRRLDGEIAKRGLTPDTPEYNQLVRSSLSAARDTIDHVLGQFFSEQRAAMKPK